MPDLPDVMSIMTSDGSEGSNSDNGKKERLLVTSEGPGIEGCRTARPEIPIKYLTILHFLCAFQDKNSLLKGSLECM